MNTWIFHSYNVNIQAYLTLTFLIRKVCVTFVFQQTFHSSLKKYDLLNL